MKTWAHLIGVVVFLIVSSDVVDGHFETVHLLMAGAQMLMTAVKCHFLGTIIIFLFLLIVLSLNGQRIVTWRHERRVGKNLKDFMRIYGKR